MTSGAGIDALPADVLAIAAHRDDVEQTCGGTLLRMAARGLRTAILDLTQGESGTRGTVEDRAREAEKKMKDSLGPDLEAVAIAQPLKEDGFILSIPAAQLVVLLVLAAIAGVLAAILPARRASRLDVLDALAYE